MRSVRDTARYVGSGSLVCRSTELSPPGREVPDWPKLLHLYSRMKPGKTVLEWMQEHKVELLGIDVRRFTSFGVIKVTFIAGTGRHNAHFHTRVSSAGFTGGPFSSRIQGLHTSRRNAGLQVLRCDGVRRAFLPRFFQSHPSRTLTN